LFEKVKADFKKKFGKFVNIELTLSQFNKYYE